MLAEELELEGVHFYHGRAEDFAQDKNFRAQFDLVTARAVARMQILSELTIPYLKLNGKLIASKSSAEDELTQAKTHSISSSQKSSKTTTILFQMATLEH